MGKILKVYSDEEAEMLGLNDFPYIEEEFENIKDDENIIGVVIPKENDKIIKFPVSTDEKNMKNKKCDYKTYCLMTLLSKYTEGENHRYLYEDDIILNKNNVEELSKTKVETIKRNMKKISKLENNLVVAKLIDGRIVYIINYKNEDGRKYVTVEEDILKRLVTNLNSRTIKTYMLLKYRCSTDKFTRIIKENININIGLNSKTGTNRKSLDITFDLLRDMDLIEKYTKQEKIKNKDGKIVYTTINYIRLLSYEEYKIKREEKKQKEQR